MLYSVVGDVTPIGGIYTGLTGIDFGTLKDLGLTEAQKGHAFGGGVGQTVVIAVGGGLALKSRTAPGNYRLSPGRTSAPAFPQLEILNPEFTPRAPLPDLVVARTLSIGVATEENSLVLWSGLKDGAAQAGAFAQRAGSTTVEMTPSGAWLEGLDLFRPASPLTTAEATAIRARVSEAAASSARGQVVVVLGNVRPGSVFSIVELPALMNNPNVRGVEFFYLDLSFGVK